MAKSIVRKSSVKRSSTRSRKASVKRSRKMTSRKASVKRSSTRSKKASVKRSRKTSSRKSKRVSYRMMPSAAGARGDIYIPVYDEVGNQTQYTIRKRDYTEMAEPYGLRYLRITPNGRPHFFDSYENAARAAFVPSAMGRVDRRVWIIQNDGTAYFVANE